MIVAILLADKSDPDSARYFAANGGATVIERVASTVLRGPFGGTLVAARPEISAKIKDSLQGFALQIVETSGAKSGAHSILIEGLKAAEAFRARWEKAMAAAALRFQKSPGKEAGGKSGGAPGDWNKHKQSADVKIRGLARSFERDGVLVLPADSVEIGKEQLARMVEAFARDGQEARPHAFVQAVIDGARGWPVIMSPDAAREVAALPVETVFAKWLVKDIERVKDVGIGTD
ncbi:MAG TPA: hypothetical protein VKX17_24215 [Planctomycetota bacterium]|nr:hypothetical protein [Planctomycetota bacterium]